MEKALAWEEPFHFEDALPATLDESFTLADTLGVGEAMEGLPDPRNCGYISLPVACAVTICRSAEPAGGLSKG
ncbi:MAG: hypothetical protein GX774_07585 [Armatimonadetes bacterium]|nr:hypothetical protein [Armatimonadota bacterium]